MNFVALAERLRALAHPLRLRILHGLCQNECNVNRLWRQLHISQPLASQHLHRLQQAGLIIGERRGQQMCYRVAEPCVQQVLDTCGQWLKHFPAPNKKRRLK